MTIAQSFAIRLEDISFNPFDDEVIVIHLGTGMYFSLRSTAAVIWGRLQQGPCSAATLAGWFGGGCEVAGQILAHLEELAGAGLLVGSSEPALVLPADGATMPFTSPQIEMFDDLQGLLLADPIHEVSDEGWPAPPEDMPRAA